jgi:hypothetical protein
MISYNNRKSLYEKVNTYSLDINHVNVEQDGKFISTIPYNSIRSIRLCYMPSRVNKENYICSFKTDNREYNFQSTDYISFAHFKSNGPDYNIFVKAFIEKTFEANPSVRLLSGKPGSVYYGGIIFLLLMMMLLAALLFLIGNAFSSIIWIKFILLLLMIPYAYRYIQNNKPGTFSASAIPLKVLPN